MQINIDEILVLENNERYIVLNKITYEENNYYLTMGIKENNEIIPSKVLFIKIEEDTLNSYIIKIKNKELISTLTKLLKNS